MTKELSSEQAYLVMIIRYRVIKERKMKVTHDDAEYLHFDNGKRFYKFGFFKGKTFLGIREDGDTRGVFNGQVKNWDDFKKVDELTMP